MVPRNRSSRAHRPHHPRRHEVGSTRGRSHEGEPAQDAHAARELRGGATGRARDQGGQVSRVLGADAEEPQERIRRGDPRRAEPAAAAEAKEEQVHRPLRGLRGALVRMGTERGVLRYLHIRRRQVSRVLASFFGKATTMERFDTLQDWRPSNSLLPRIVLSPRCFVVGLCGL